jgi:hypothetical protein
MLVECKLKLSIDVQRVLLQDRQQGCTLDLRVRISPAPKVPIETADDWSDDARVFLHIPAEIDPSAATSVVKRALRTTLSFARHWWQFIVLERSLPSMR